MLNVYTVKLAVRFGTNLLVLDQIKCSSLQFFLVKNVLAHWKLSQLISEVFQQYDILHVLDRYVPILHGVKIARFKYLELTCPGCNGELAYTCSGYCA